MVMKMLIETLYQPEEVEIILHTMNRFCMMTKGEELI
jgi:hypothetical protein